MSIKEAFSYAFLIPDTLVKVDLETGMWENGQLEYYVLNMCSITNIIKTYADNTREHYRMFVCEETPMVCALLDVSSHMLLQHIATS